MVAILPKYLSFITPDLHNCYHTSLLFKCLQFRVSPVPPFSGGKKMKIAPVDSSITQVVVANITIS
jgi:hypothetical protein